jgi:hypothetical protein
MGGNGEFRFVPAGRRLTAPTRPFVPGSGGLGCLDERLLRGVR